jgi:hypothetical protein
MSTLWRTSFSLICQVYGENVKSRRVLTYTSRTISWFSFHMSSASRPTMRSHVTRIEGDGLKATALGKLWARGLKKLIVDSTSVLAKSLFLCPIELTNCTRQIYSLTCQFEGPEMFLNTPVTSKSTQSGWSNSDVSFSTASTRLHDRWTDLTMITTTWYLQAQA